MALKRYFEKTDLRDQGKSRDPSADFITMSYPLVPQSSACSWQGSHLDMNLVLPLPFRGCVRLKHFTTKMRCMQKPYRGCQGRLVGSPAVGMPLVPERQSVDRKTKLNSKVLKLRTSTPCVFAWYASWRASRLYGLQTASISLQRNKTESTLNHAEPKALNTPSIYAAERT